MTNFILPTYLRHHVSMKLQISDYLHLSSFVINETKKKKGNQDGQKQRQNQSFTQDSLCFQKKRQRIEGQFFPKDSEIQASFFQKKIQNKV